MRVKLSDLTFDTVFKWSGRTFKKGSTCCAIIYDSGRFRPFDRFNDDKDRQRYGTKCYPLLGGKFQSNLGFWIPDDDTVDVSF